MSNFYDKSPYAANYAGHEMQNYNIPPGQYDSRTQSNQQYYSNHPYASAASSYPQDSQSYNAQPVQSQNNTSEYQHHPGNFQQQQNYEYSNNYQGNFAPPAYPPESYQQYSHEGDFKQQSYQDNSNKVTYPPPPTFSPVTAAEHKANMKIGFWPGFFGGLLFTFYANILLLMYRVPMIPMGGDPRPSIAARGKQIGLLFGVATGSSVTLLGWIILIIVELAGNKFQTYYTKNRKGYYSNAFSFNYFYFLFAALWLIGVLAGYFSGSSRNKTLKKEHEIVD